MALKDTIARRGRRAVAHTQADTFFLFGLALATDPAFRAEVEQARAGRQAPLVRDTAAIVRGCIAGALRPEEAVELFKRAQGG
jgi:hypothetical protein